MAKSTPKKLAYMKTYQDTPEEIKKREARNRARQAAIKSGKAHVGDGTQVDHKKMLDQGGSEDLSNTRVISRHQNEGWRSKAPSAYTKKGK
jgi:hypothetical protein